MKIGRAIFLLFVLTLAILSEETDQPTPIAQEVAPPDKALDVTADKNDSEPRNLADGSPIIKSQSIATETNQLASNGRRKWQKSMFSLNDNSGFGRSASAQFNQSTMSSSSQCETVIINGEKKTKCSESAQRCFKKCDEATGKCETTCRRTLSPGKTSKRKRRSALSTQIRAPLKVALTSDFEKSIPKVDIGIARDMKRMSGIFKRAERMFEEDPEKW